MDQSCLLRILCELVFWGLILIIHQRPILSGPKPWPVVSVVGTWLQEAATSIMTVCSHQMVYLYASDAANT